MYDIKDPVFGHHQPLTVEFLKGRVLSRLEGCYRTRLQVENHNVEAGMLVGRWSSRTSRAAERLSSWAR